MIFVYNEYLNDIHVVNNVDRIRILCLNMLKIQYKAHIFMKKISLIYIFNISYFFNFGKSINFTTSNQIKVVKIWKK